MAYANGLIPAKALVSIGQGQALELGAAISWLKLAQAALTAGHSLRLTDSYRPRSVQERIFLQRYARQSSGGGFYGDVRHYNGVRYVRKRGTASASVPGTSNHGSGLAVDITGINAGYGNRPTDAYRWLSNNASAYGWTNPAWAKTRNFWEPWHWEYNPSHDTKPTPPPTIPKDWFDMATEEQLRKIVKEELSGVGRQVWGYTNTAVTKQDAYHHLLRPNIDAGYLAEAFWRYTLKSRSDDKSYQARTFLTVNNARLNTLLGEALPDLFDTLAGLADDSGVSADEMRKQIADVFAGVRLQLVTEADGE